MPDPKVLADKPIVDRRGDDVLDRHVHAVIDHPETVADDEIVKIIEDGDAAKGGD